MSRSRSREAEPVDVDALLDEIRRRLDAARPGDATQGSPVAGGEPPLPEEALSRAVELLRRAPPTEPVRSFRSHRGGVVGALVVATKRLVGALVMLPLGPVLERQARREAAHVGFAEEVYKRVVGMEADLRERLERVEARQAMELEGLRRRLAELEARAPDVAGGPASGTGS